MDKNEAAIKKMHAKLDGLFDELVETIELYTKSCDKTELTRAYNFGLVAHIKQLRQSGEPYFVHCLNVAKILAELRMDHSMIIAALLHDVVEDTPITVEELTEMFGETTSFLVDGVTKISNIRYQSKEEQQADTFRKMLLSMAKDVRVIIIKFADRLHNMRTLNFMPDDKRTRISIETRDIYAPLAHRLGIAKIKTELEDLCLKYLEPKAYSDLVKKIKLSRKDRQKYIQSISDPIEAELLKNNIKADISGRPKSFFSIHNKMVKRNKPFEEIYDLLAIRIIVDKIEECYYTLGIIHSKFMPVYDRFKDYIAMPKINGYQSLHTTVIGPNGRMIEIQIRTMEMHEMAENGIAAHWRYKGGEEGDEEVDKHLNWVRDLLERQMHEDDPEDFLENLKIDLFQDEVFVFTPNGDLFKLPKDSTPIDFAYAIHTNIGNHCIASKVNGRIVPLKYILKSGEQVEIITSQNQKPAQDWLSVVKTSKARHWIKKILRDEQNAQISQIGNEILLKFLKKHKLTEKKQEFLDVLPKFGFQTVESIKVALGKGDLTVEDIRKHLFPEVAEEVVEDENFIVKFLKRARTGNTIRVQGIDNMLINFANCCQPVPGDRIIGYLTRGKGVTIHRTDCNNMMNLYREKERIIEVEWATAKDQEFHVHLSVLGEDRKDLLRDITLCVSRLNINIIAVNFMSEDMYARGFLDILIKDLSQLTKIINNIGRITGVLSVERVDNANLKNS
jgi:GTP pyrophosphokinase